MCWCGKHWRLVLSGRCTSLSATIVGPCVVGTSRGPGGSGCWSSQRSGSPSGSGGSGCRVSHVSDVRPCCCFCCHAWRPHGRRGGTSPRQQSAHVPVPFPLVSLRINNTRECVGLGQLGIKRSEAACSEPQCGTPNRNFGWPAPKRKSAERLRPLTEGHGETAAQARHVPKSAQSLSADQ